MYTLGIDTGSTTSKCAVLKDGKELVAHSLQTGGLGTGGPGGGAGAAVADQRPDPGRYGLRLCHRLRPQKL